MMQDPKLANGERRTVVEEGTHLEGSLSSNCPIVMSGKIDGDVSAPSLRINKTGSVRGKVKVEEVDSQGEMSGEIEADIVRLGGIVHDDSIVRAKTLEVRQPTPTDPQPITFGACTLEVGDLPDKEAVIRASREGQSLRPPEPVLRASAPPPDGLAGASDDLGDGRSAARRKASAAAKRP
jgi:cytoskeletal protein CcmA (bactofilin family)